MDDSSNSLFLSLPHPSCIVNYDINKEDNNLIIINVNNQFEKKIMSKMKSVGLSLLSDLISGSDLSKFSSVLKSFINTIITKKKENDFVDPCCVEECKTLILVGSSDFPVTVSYDWIISEISCNSNLITLLLTGHKKDTNHEIGNRPDTLEFIDFFQKAPIALHWLSGTGQIIWANDTELQTLGYTAEEYIGHSIMEFCPEETDHVLEVFQKLASGETIRNVPFKFRAKNGDPKYLLIDSNVSYHPDGTFNHTRCFIRDDNERRIREAVFKTKMDSLAMLMNAKDSFIRRMFHEIKTPLHAIQTSLSIALHANRNTQVEIMKDLYYQMEYCMGIVDDLSFITMLEENKILSLRPEHLNLQRELNLILTKLKECDEFRSKLASSRIVANVDKNLSNRLLLDRSLLRAINNLTSNAVRFSKAGEDIELQLSYETKEGKLCFQVTNSISGPVDEAAIHKAFQYYYQSDMNSQSSSSSSSDCLSQSLMSLQGLGLGLYVSYHVVSLLGGMLDFTTDEDSITFRFSLPVTSEDIPDMLVVDRDNDYNNDNDLPVAKRVRGSEDWSSMFTAPVVDQIIVPEQSTTLVGSVVVTHNCSDISKKRVLVVDDSPICQKVMRKILSVDYDVDVASNGLEAVNILSADPCIYDLVLMDLRMPMMDGITATRECRLQKHLESLPIIILTAEVGDDIRAVAKTAGSSYFMCKPAKEQELKSKLLELIKKC